MSSGPVVDAGTVRGRVTLDTAPLEQGLQESEQAVRRWGSNAKKAAMVAGAAVGAALGAAVVGAVNLQPVQSKVTAQLGLTEAQAKKAGKAAGAVYRDGWGESLADANQLTGDVLSAIEGLRDKTDEEIARVTSRIATISETFELEAQLVAQVSNQLVTSGMADNIDQATDVMAASFQKVPASARDELADAYSEYTKHAADLGMSAEAFAGVLVRASAEGSMGVDKAGDAIKEFSIRAQDGSATTAEAFQSLGFDAQQMAQDIASGGPKAEAAFQRLASALAAVEDPAERNRLGVALMGTAYEDLGSKQEEFLQSLATGSQTMADAGGTVEWMGEVIADTASARIEVAKRAVISWGVEGIGNVLLPAIVKLIEVLSSVLGPVLSGLGAAFGAVGRWMVRNREWLLPLAAAFASYAAVIGLATAALKIHAAIQGIMAAGGFVKWILAIVKATRAYTVAQAALNLVMSLNPIVFIIAAIVALVAAIVVAYKKSDTFREIVNAAFSRVWEIAKAVGAWFAGPFKDFFVGAFEWISEKFALWKAMFLLSWEIIKTTVTTIVSALWNGVTTTFNAVVGFFQGIWDNVRAIFDAFVAVHVAAWNNAKAWVLGVVTGIRDGVVGFFTGIRDGVTGIIVALAVWLYTTWESIRSNVVGRVAALRDGVVGIFTALWSHVVSWVGNIRDAIVAGFSAARQAAIDHFTRLKAGVENLANNLLHAVRNIWNRFPDSIKEPVRAAVRWVNEHFIGKLNKTLSDLKISFRVPEIPGFASGRVPGHTPTDSSDNMLAWLTPGETVIRRRSTMKLESQHPGLLSHMNKYGTIPGYAGGGHAMPNANTKPWPKYVAALARRLFPGINAIYGQGNRPIKTSYHHTGDALDFMVHKNKPLGDQIAAWGTKNARPLVLDQIIWYDRIQSPVNGRWRGYRHPFGNNPTLRHLDHPHFSFSRGKWGMPELLGTKLSPEEVAAITAGSAGAGGMDAAFDFSIITEPLKKILDKWNTAALSPWSDIAKAAMAAIPDGITATISEHLPSLGFSSSVEEGGYSGKGVERWRPLVLQALQTLGQPATLVGSVLRRMNQESGGNPRAINNWDSNARRGTPSKGLMQVIDPTFRANARAPYNRDIWDPLSNILASMRYAMARYGSLARAYNRKGGYALGTLNATAGLHQVGENGPELVLGPSLAKFSGGEKVVPLRMGSGSSMTPEMIREALDGMRVDMDNGRAWFTRHADVRDRDAARRERAMVGRM